MAFSAISANAPITGQHYTVLGYKGKQVRDNIHAYDLVTALWHFFQKPRIGEVYNIGVLQPFVRVFDAGSASKFANG